MHTWDVVVALDRSATVAPDAVELLIDGLPDLVARVGKPTAEAATLQVSTTDPERTFALVTDGVRLEPWTERAVDRCAGSSAEELLRLAYGRLDAAHAPTAHLERRASPSTTCGRCSRESDPAVGSPRQRPVSVSLAQVTVKTKAWVTACSAFPLPNNASMVRW